MNLVITSTFVMATLSLLVMYLSYCSRKEIIKGLSIVLLGSFVFFYLSVWLSSYDEMNLKIGEKHSCNYRVFQSRADLMWSYFGVSGVPAEENEDGCFFISMNGKVAALPLKDIGLSDYSMINSSARYVIENTVLVRSNPAYFDVKVNKHREYLEVFDYRLRKTATFYRAIR